jgi:oligopeptide transport system ATP-binding protein
MHKEKILEINDLRVDFQTYKGTANALDLAHLEVYRGESFGLAGESGSGKSVIAQAVLGLIPCPPGDIPTGEIIFEGKDILKMREDELKKMRGSQISMIFQDPMSSLNPVFTVGEQITRIIRQHKKVSSNQAYKDAVELLKTVKLPDPETTIKKYPHELSGGMRQRVVIAMALSCGAEFIIADEPTRALDVTIQAGILELLDDLRAKENTTVLMIGNNLAILSHMCQRLGLLYAGQIVEMGLTEKLISNPIHPYTKALISAIPDQDGKNKKLSVTPGFPPDPINMPQGCRFCPRCEIAEASCSKTRPPMLEVETEHWVACYKAGVQGRTN